MAEPEGPPFLVVAASARALTESALRSRRRPRVVAVDLFGDRDLRAIAPWHPAADAGRGEPTLRGCLATAARLIAAGGVDGLLPGGGTEHAADALARAAGRRPLLASSPEAIAAVRDPARLFGWLAGTDLPHPSTWLPPATPPPDAPGPFLLKPRASGGGLRIRPWSPGRPIPRGYVVQVWLAGGVPIGAAALADGRRAVLLGLSIGLAGDPAFGARGFAYAGSLLGPVGGADYPRLALEAERAAGRLAAAFGLRGLFGIDFMLHGAHLHLLEVNPRYTASMELIEQATGASVVDLHLDALEGRLPADPAPWRRLACGPERGRFRGKGIVYAERPVVAPDTDAWLAAGWRDVPHAGERIRAGAPVCTVFAGGAGEADCLAALRAEAAAVYRSWE